MMSLEQESNKANNEACEIQDQSSQGSSNPTEFPMIQLNSLEDLDSLVDAEQSQLVVLDRLERKWEEIYGNFSQVMQHLERCGQEVSSASLDCLTSLSQEAGETCKRANEEMRALYLVMNKCDELTTKLSVAESFREEIKTLRKSVETLENLSK